MASGLEKTGTPDSATYRKSSRRSIITGSYAPPTFLTITALADVRSTLSQVSLRAARSSVARPRSTSRRRPVRAATASANVSEDQLPGVPTTTTAGAFSATQDLFRHRKALQRRRIAADELLQQ